VSDRIYRVLVIGTGFATRVQIPVFLRHPRFEVVAVSSRSEARGAEVAAQFGIPRHSPDWAALAAEPDVDVVSVVSEVPEHRVQAIGALEAGKHLILEKPLAATAADAAAVLEARPAGACAAINHEFRLQPKVQLLKALFDSGELGELRGAEWRSASAFWADPEARTHGWLSRADRNGGLLLAMGSHQVDMMQYLTGRKVTAVSGEAWTVVGERRDADGNPRPVTADDSAVMLLTLEGGIRARTLVTGAQWLGEDVIRIHGSRAGAAAEGNTVRVSRSDGTEEVREPEPAPDWDAGEKDIRKPAFHRWLTRFAAWCDGEEPRDLASLEDGVAVMRVLEAVRGGTAVTP